MANDDNEWGIDEIEDETGGPGKSQSFMEEMPGMEVTAGLTDAMSREIIEKAVTDSEEIIKANDIPMDEDDLEVSKMTTDFDIQPIEYIPENDDDSIYEDIEEPVVSEDVDEIDESNYEQRKPKTNKKKQNKAIEEDDEEDNKSKIITIASIGLFILIIIIGIVILFTLFGKSGKNDDDDYVDEEGDYEIVDVYGNDLEEENSGLVENTTENEASTEDTSSNSNKPSEETKSQCEINGHDYQAATCTEAKICRVCGVKSGEPLGHDFSEASCLEASKCSRCGAVGTAALGHNYEPATCTEPKTCSRCEATEGEALGHDYADATCTTAKTCRRCGATEGNALDHDYVQSGSSTSGTTVTTTYTCSRCGDIKTEEKTVAVTGTLPEQVINLVNADRAANGLAPVSSTPELMNAAAARAIEISSSFSHNRPDGSSCFTALSEYGVSYSACGENIAAGQASASDVENSWMNSPGHRSNILNAGYSHIGVGYYYSGSGYNYYWVQLFTN